MVDSLGQIAGAGFQTNPYCFSFMDYFSWNISDFTGNPDRLCCVNLESRNYGMESWYGI